MTVVLLILIMTLVPMGIAYLLEPQGQLQMKKLLSFFGRYKKWWVIPFLVTLGIQLLLIYLSNHAKIFEH